MIQKDDKSVKILSRFYSNVLDEWTVETMWAEEFQIPQHRQALPSAANINNNMQT